ncbi:hypothetical protein QQS21_008883 [Conoideocrella luteorostrata]|uniref:Lustrin A n=1 Tax=Conoideocrella luteorostrata TaxID=1105319 RepID=A0AAJ0CI81_9HYPO|nr:hypothetical protein QQS21_008883 [Conoideocrella luteorostrata]
MKTSVTALGMLAAVASAYQPGRHLHFPRGNGTENMTTLTIKTTQIHTVTSCAPTVTNCPAHPTAIATLPENQKTTMVVTETIVLSTTVCPVTEAGKVSSSIIAKASTGGLTGTTQAATTISQAINPTVPINGSSAKPSMTTKVTDVVTEKTMTVTLGTGSTASVATSVVRATVQKTVTVPCTEATAAPVASTESTTTKTATTKVTRTVTVSRTKPTGPVDNKQIVNSSGAGECAASTVTVKETVTAPASTVYVTVGGPAATNAGNEKPAVTQPPTSDKSSNSGNNNKGSDKSKVSSDCPDQTTTLQATVTVVPYPSGNGTHSSGHAKPSGFARLRR